MGETQHGRPALPPDIQAFFVVNYGNGDSFSQTPSPAPMVEYYGAYEPADRAAGLFNLLHQAPDTHEGWREAGVNIYDSANPTSTITASIADVASRDEQTTAHLVNMFGEALRGDAENDLTPKLTAENVQLFVTRGWNTPGADPRAVARMLQFGRQQLGAASDLFGYRMPLLRRDDDMTSAMSFADTVSGALYELGEAELGAELRNATASAAKAQQERLLQQLAGNIVNHIKSYAHQRRETPSAYWKIKDSIDSLRTAHPTVATDLDLRLAAVVSRGAVDDLLHKGTFDEGIITADAARVFDTVIASLREGTVTLEMVESLRWRKTLLDELERRCTLTSDQEVFGRHIQLIREMTDDRSIAPRIRSDSEFYRKIITKTKLSEQQLGFRPGELPARVSDVQFTSAGVGVFYKSPQDAIRHLEEGFGIPEDVVRHGLEQGATVDIGQDAQCRIEPYNNGYTISFSGTPKWRGRPENTGSGHLRDLLDISGKEAIVTLPPQIRFNLHPHEAEVTGDTYHLVEMPTIVNLSHTCRRIAQSFCPDVAPPGEPLTFLGAGDMADKLQRAEKRGRITFELPIDSAGRIILSFRNTMRRPEGQSGASGDELLRIGFKWGTPIMHFAFRGLTPSQALEANKSLKAYEHLVKGRRRL